MFRKLYFKLLSRQEEFFYSSVGRLTICWSFLETSLDFIILELKDKKDSFEHPRPLKRKINLIKSSINQIPELKDKEEKIKNFLAEVSLLAEIRHQIIHGTLRSHKKIRKKGAKLRFIKNLHDKDIKAEKDFTAFEISQYAKQVANLAEYGLDLYFEIESDIKSVNLDLK